MAIDLLNWLTGHGSNCPSWGNFTSTYGKPKGP